MNLKTFFTGKAIGFLVVLVVVGLVAFAYSSKNKKNDTASAPYAVADYKNGEYMVQGVKVRLNAGVAEQEIAPGSAAKITTLFMGGDLQIDLDQDGREDAVFLLSQETGGSGTFFYVVAALQTDRGYVGSDAFLLGDRVAPQTIEKGNGAVVVVNYADRKPGEAFSVAPSVGKTVWLLLDPKTMQWGQVEQNFSGEANPASMTLGMKTWSWTSVLVTGEAEVKPKQKEAFTLTFGSDGKFTATTDCNSMGGTYKAQGTSLVFSDIFSTKKFCEGSQEVDFALVLSRTESYRFTTRGELILDFRLDAGSATFR